LDESFNFCYINVIQMDGKASLGFDATVVPKEEYSELIPLISGLEVTDKTFLFTVTCSLFPEVEKTFFLRFSPGTPVVLEIMGEDTAVARGGKVFTLPLSRDEPSKPFTLCCFDMYGNRTGPERGARWTLAAGAGPLEPFEGLHPSPDGAMTLQALQPRVAETGFQTQHLVLTVVEKGHESVTIDWEFNVEITAPPSPAAIQVSVAHPIPCFLLLASCFLFILLKLINLFSPPLLFLLDLV
jgi:hypothetical protein